MRYQIYQNYYSDMTYNQAAALALAYVDNIVPAMHRSPFIHYMMII